ncbi:MAG TPA: hypothetical protein VFX20_15550 [Steroidobacteraceae bacterium]|nr:hypothetical protein [Steroidobacteraceae bacterium]
MDERERRTLEQGLERYFEAYESSQSLASELIRRREHPIDLLILLCARLDALASDASSEELSHRERFSRFITHYGSHRQLFEAVSIPDLYYEIGFHRWRLEQTISAPGRLHRYGRLDDAFLHLIEDSGLPLTVKEMDRMLDTVTRILEGNFRAKARQPLSKSRTASVTRLKELIESAVRKTRLRRIANRLPSALRPLMDRARVSIILYERFRCESIHGASVRIDNRRFFSEQSVYWKPIYPIYAGRKYELLEFSANFLLDCLKTCIGGYRNHLLAKGKVPHGIYFHAFEDAWSMLHFLDEDSLSDGGAVRLKFDR